MAAPPSSCPVCGSSGAPAFEENGHPHSRCADCRIVFLTRPPPPEAVMAQYAHASGQTYHRSEEIAQAGERRSEARRRLRVLGRWLPHRPGRFLEIGCGGGAFLAEMSARGWSVEGLELSPELAEDARRRWSVEIRTCTLAAAAYPDAVFDAAGLFEVLSHLRDPLGDLREVARVLRPGGVLLLETGNGGELSRAGMPRWGAPEHIVHFSRGGLGRLLRRAGFQVLAVRRRALHFQRAALQMVSILRGARGRGGPVTGSHPPASGDSGRRALRGILSSALLFARYELGMLGARAGVPCTMLVAARKNI